MASKKKKGNIKINRFVALLVVLLVAVAASILLLIQTNIRLVSNLFNKQQAQNTQDKSAGETINCNKKIAQKGDSLASLIEQGKDSASCLFMGCSGFFQ